MFDIVPAPEVPSDENSEEQITPNGNGEDDVGSGEGTEGG